MEERVEFRILALIATVIDAGKGPGAEGVCAISRRSCPPGG
jgi:hypothetical protein